MMIDMQKISSRRWREPSGHPSDESVQDAAAQEQVLWKKIPELSSAKTQPSASSSRIYITRSHAWAGRAWLMGGVCLFVTGFIFFYFIASQKNNASFPLSDSTNLEYIKSAFMQRGQELLPGPKSGTISQWTPPLRATLTVLDSVWIRASVDGSILFEGLLYRGMTEQWSCQESLVLKIADPSKISISKGGSIFNFPEQILKAQRPVTVSFQSAQKPLVTLD